MQFTDINESMGWPPEMRVRIAANADSLLELLWLRHRGIGEAAPSMPAADLPGEPVAADDPFLVSAWEALWGRALECAALSHEQESPRATELATRLGMDVDEPVRAWARGLTDAVSAEYAVAADLEAAWRAGLRVVIDLPLRGEYSERIDASTLLVSTPCRSDPFAYLRALTRFARAA